VPSHVGASLTVDTHGRVVVGQNVTPPEVFFSPTLERPAAGCPRWTTTPGSWSPPQPKRSGPAIWSTRPNASPPKTAPATGKPRPRGARPTPVLPRPPSPAGQAPVQRHVLAADHGSGRC